MEFDFPSYLKDISIPLRSMKVQKLTWWTLAHLSVYLRLAIPWHCTSEGSFTQPSKGLDFSHRSPPVMRITDRLWTSHFGLPGYESLELL
jgi:hypothetical protein